MAENTKARRMREALRALILTHGALNEARRPCGTAMPTEHAWALMELESEPMTVTTLAAKLGIDRTNVSRLCKRLESAGEVEKIEHPDDGRARLVQLTEEGRRVASSLDETSATYFESVCQNLENSSENTMIEALEELTRAIRSAREST